MTLLKPRAIITIAVCALSLAAVASMKKPVTRPLKLHATAHWIVSLSDGSATDLQRGESTHTGLIIDVGTGVWDLNTFTLLSGTGVTTTANGEQIFWDMSSGPYLVNFTGGTGRFAGATGGFNVVSQGQPVVTPGPVAGTVAIEVSYTGEGTVTY